MRRFLGFLVEYGLLLIITIPSFVSLINPYFYPMHDSQQVARLYVLTEGLKQGNIYPRWVDLFGFNFGYPLFNFYPPVFYYAGVIFHTLGFSYLWSTKMVIISGYVLSAIGMYLLTKKILGRDCNDLVVKCCAYVAAVLYTYFTYHAVNAYVRGAMAEFFSMAVLPFVFLALESLRQNTNLRNALFFGVMFGLLILTHPLIAFPGILFIGTYILHSIVLHKKYLKYTIHAAVGGITGLLLSAFFWLPSMIERKYTMVDTILLKELASYKLHFVCPSQLWYSPWGYGGSVPGCIDGMSFQLGKVHILLALFSLILCLVVLFMGRKKARKVNEHIFNDFGFFFTILLYAIFMTTMYSLPIWNSISYLQYLQFPWRFLTFAGIFISLVGGYGIYFCSIVASSLSSKHPALRAPLSKEGKSVWVVVLVAVLISLVTIFTYQKYFRPQSYQHITDKELTSFDEIAWRVSRTSFEFAPKGIKTKKSDVATTVPAIEKSNLNRSAFDISGGTGGTNVIKNEYASKVFDVDSTTGFTFTLHTFNFPGWNAYIDGQKTKISDNNDFKLITILVPAGNHQLRFSFEDTPVRKIADWVSILSLSAVIICFILIVLKRNRGNKSGSQFI